MYVGGYIRRTSVPDFLELYRQMRGKIRCVRNVAGTNVSRLYIWHCRFYARGYKKRERERVTFYRQHQSILWLRHCAFPRFTYSRGRKTGQGRARRQSLATRNSSVFLQLLYCCSFLISRLGERDWFLFQNYYLTNCEKLHEKRIVLPWFPTIPLVSHDENFETIGYN